VSHAGTGLLAELADRSGMTEAMSVAMGDCGISWHTHDPGVVLTHMAVAIADGADCLAQLRVLRDQEALFGPVASHATAWRAVQAVASVELRAIAVARATARARVWAAGGAPATVTLDFDATLVDAHSDKQDAAPTYKRGFGFHPLGVWCDETGEALAAMLRPGNAGANHAGDHITMLDAALAQLPAAWRAGHRAGDDAAEVVHPILVRADSAGATHAFVAALVERNIGYSIGFDVDGRVRDALLLAQEEDWVPAVEADGSRRPGAWVTELTDLAELGTWPEGTRLICRRERPTPVPSYRCSTSAKGSATPASSPARPASPLPWSWASAATPGSRTASGRPRTAGCATFPSRTSCATRRGWPWSSWPRTCWPGPPGCASTAPWPRPSRRRCATGSCTSQPVWPAEAETCTCVSTQPGRGATSSPPPSAACAPLSAE
jgi:hypothetical protein